MATVDLDLGSYRLGWHDDVEYAFTPRKGLDEGVIREISAIKGEPEWMLAFRLKAYDRFLKKPIPQWGGGGLLNTIDFNDIYYYVKPAGEQQKDWDMVPEGIKATYEKLGIPQAERKYLAGVTAQYECLRGDVRVYTANRGLVPIKNVEAGDRVFSLDEETGELSTAAVLSAAQTDTMQTYRVTVGSRFHRTIHATDNHPVLTLVDARKPGRQRARYEKRWKTVAELEVGDLVAVSRDLPEFGESHRLNRLDSTPAHFPSETTVDLMWLLGLWIGDGYTRNDSQHGTYRVEIAIPETDPELRAELARVVNDLFGLNITTPDEWRIAFASKALVAWLEANGILGTSHTKRFPSWVFGLPSRERLAFLGGYVDADGYVSPHHRGNVMTITSVNTALLGDAEELARLCGLRVSGPHKFTSKHPFDADRLMIGYRLGLSGDVERLSVRNPRRSERLGSRAYRHNDTSARGATFRAHTTNTLGFGRVTEIEPDDIAPVYDIEVDGMHNFVAEGLVVHNSEVVYHRNREDLEKLGVLFTDMDTALREYPDIVKKYFGTIIPPNDNKFAALNSAVWSGGSFIYVPPGVHVDQPLQAYFRINSENMGQFERTLIIVDEGAFVHYVEGCSAPVYTTDSLHAAVVEIIVKEGARCRYTTIQNWSNNVFNLVTKRAVAYRNATMEWVDANLGCLAEGSTVTTRSGPKAIELVMPGDEVMSWDETAEAFVWSTVTAKRYSGEQPVSEVRVGERRIKVTANHPFYSYKHDSSRAKKLGRYELAYVRADELSEAIVPRTSLDYGEPHKLVLPGNEVLFASRNQYQEAFEAQRTRKSRIRVGETTTDDLMWLIGLFVGDGSIDSAPAANGGHRWSKVVFSVPSADRARARLVDVMNQLMPDTDPSERKDGVTLSWNSVELAELLEGNGLVSGAQNKRLPDWVYHLPESQRLALLAGLLDSDGCAPRGRRGFSIKSVSRPLLEDVARLATTLGIPARIHTEHDDERPVSILGIESVSHGSHRIDFPVDVRLLDHVSDSLRKVALAQSAPSLKWHRRVGRSSIELSEHLEIRKVAVTEPVDTVPTWDIEVAETGNFVAEGFVVHNSRLTMKYPAVWLMEPGAHGEVLSIAFAGEGQHQDAGAKMVHVAPDTTSTIVSKSIAKGGGRSGYRGLVRVEPGAENAKSFVRCDALILDENSRSDTYPYMEIEENDAEIGHEATVSKVGEEQLFYLMSRGLTEDQATSLIVAGFIEPIVKELPMEYAVEMNRLIELNMAEAGAVG